jgi:hypothetical protein
VNASALCGSDSGSLAKGESIDSQWSPDSGMGPDRGRGAQTVDHTLVTGPRHDRFSEHAAIVAIDSPADWFFGLLTSLGRDPDRLLHHAQCHPPEELRCAGGERPDPADTAALM